MFFFVWFLIPETKGLSLEKMDELFGVTELVKNVEDDRERQASASGHEHGRPTELGLDGKEVSTVERREVAAPAPVEKHG
jgi:hypothetical protein